MQLQMPCRSLLNPFPLGPRSGFPANSVRARRHTDVNETATAAWPARHDDVTWSSPGEFGVVSGSVISSQKSMRPLTVKPSSQLRTALVTPSGVAAALTGWWARPPELEPKIRALRPPSGSPSSHTLRTRTPLRSASSEVTANKVQVVRHGLVASAYGQIRSVALLRVRLCKVAA